MRPLLQTRAALALILGLGAVAGPAAAQEKAIVAECGNAGCRCQLAAVTPDEAAVTYGIDLPAAGETTLIVTPGGAEWTTLSPDRIDADHGGDGSCVLELFPEIRPQDGTWTGTVVAESVQGCPAAMAPALREATAGMVQVRRIDWGGAFHPDRLSDAPQDSGIEWTQVSATEFTGSGRSEQPGGPMRLLLRYSARLLAPDRAIAGLRLTIGMATDDAAANAILAQAGLTNCRVVARYDFVRTAD